MNTLSESQFLAPLQAGMATGTLFALDEEESNHACKVFRHRAGDQLRVGNGLGLQGIATLVRADTRSAGLELVDLFPSAAAPRIHLAIACLKDNDLEEVMESCGQLALASLTLLRTAHSQEPRDSDLKRTVRRLELKSQVAFKQSLKPWQTTVHGPLPFQAWLQNLRQHPVLCDIDGQVRLPAELCAATAPELVLAVGPEGGFSPAEQEALRNRQAAILSLGSTRLRAKTCPAIALGALIGMGVEW